MDARGKTIASVQNAESLNRSFSRVSQSGSQLSAGESLTLTSGKDIEIEASEVSSEDRLDITAGGDLKVLSASDTMQSTHTNYEVSMFGGVKRTTVKESSVTHRASTLRSGGHAVIQTGGDVTVLGSSLDVDGHAVIQSECDVKVLAGDAGHDLQTTSKRRGFFSESKGSSLQSSLEKVGSTVTVDGGLVVTSQGKAMLQAANLDVGGLELRAEKGVSVLSAETQTVSVSESTTKGWFNKRHKKDESVTTDHDASVVASRSDVTMATNGGLTIAGSEIRSAEIRIYPAQSGCDCRWQRLKKETVSESSGFSGISLSVRDQSELNIENKRQRRIGAQRLRADPRRCGR